MRYQVQAIRHQFVHLKKKSFAQDNKGNSQDGGRKEVEGWYLC